MNTYMPKAEDIKQEWYIIDAANKPLGRVASEAARLLRGKHKPTFAPHVDTGDFVIIINAAEVILTGHKLDQKRMYRHSGFPGGLKETTYRTLLETKPELAVEKAVQGMLPKNRLGHAMASKLKVYAGADHKHQAQKPQVWENWL